MLHGDLKMNGRPIGHWQAHRLSSLGQRPEEDQICTYEWMLVQYSDDGGRKVTEGRLKHRYGDGGWALARAIFAQVERPMEV